MSSRFPTVVVVMLAACALLVAASGHTPPPSLASAPRVEAPPPPPEPERPIDRAAPNLRPPQRAEMLEALERAFSGAAPFDDVRLEQAVTGDFNGDRSADVALPLRAPRERLDAVNAELANWFVQDPSVAEAGLAASPPRIAADDLVLAVIHGVGPVGWRSADARQAFLLTLTDSDGRIERLPREKRDFIYEGRGHRFLYWTGARYAWHTTMGPPR